MTTKYHIKDLPKDEKRREKMSEKWIKLYH